MADSDPAPVDLSDAEVVIEVRDLVRKFGERTVLKGITFDVRKGDALAIMGGSGCGKSTLLRHVVGILKPTSGSVRIFGKDTATLSSREHDQLRRRFGMNFQFGALLQSLTVAENVALPLRENSEVDPAIIDLIVTMKLELVGLTGFEDLKPAEISGGMRKRVGLARAVALDPELLFSDEPTSGLDPIMTAVIDELTLDLTRKLNMTAVIVTHDMTSAFRIATKMIVLGAGPKQGTILAMGTPEEIRASDDPEVQQFINGHPDGPIPLRLAKEDYLDRLIGNPHEHEK